MFGKPKTENVDLEKLAKEKTQQNKKERHQDVKSRVDQYKSAWDKNGVMQFKNERVAILQRMWGQQVEFIIAYDDLTEEGYELKAIDEGKTGGQASGGFTGGVNAYFYFQKIKSTSSD